MDAIERRPKYYDALIEDFTKKIDRQWILGMLRDQHGLSLHAAQSLNPEEIRRRQAAYETDLEILMQKWAKEDADEKSS